MKELVLLCIILAVVAYVALDYLSLPVVFVDRSTGECVSLIQPESVSPYTCDRLPSRYHLEYVR